MKWSKRARRLVHHLLRLHRDRWPIPEAASLAIRFLAAYENDSGDLNTNGEQRVLRALSTFDFETVLDVGANVGDWAAAAHRLLPCATIHCFEIAPDTRAHLVARFAGDPRVRIASAGLLDRAGEVEIYTPDGHPTMTSVVTLFGGGATPHSTARVIRGDDYLRAARLERVDLLKIDVEGAELRVLDGFRELLAARRARCIQFEFSPHSVIAGTFLRNAYELLAPLGYDIGKVYPRYVAFRPYDLSHEVFLRCNFVAVHRNDLPIRKALSRA